MLGGGDVGCSQSEAEEALPPPHPAPPIRKTPPEAIPARHSAFQGSEGAPSGDASGGVRPPSLPSAPPPDGRGRGLWAGLPAWLFLRTKSRKRRVVRTEPPSLPPPTHQPIFCPTTTYPLPTFLPGETPPPPPPILPTTTPLSGRSCPEAPSLRPPLRFPTEATTHPPTHPFQARRKQAAADSSARQPTLPKGQRERGRGERKETRGEERKERRTGGRTGGKTAGKTDGRKRKGGEMAYQAVGDWPQADVEWGGPAGEDAEFRLILVGKSGGGKSATGNTILGQRVFQSILGVKTTTLRCQRGEGRWMSRKVYVVDTPALFESENYDEIVRREVMSCIDFSRPGPHALILVTQVGRFTAEDVTAAKCVWDIFGAESARHTIVLFTCQEDLGGSPLQEYVAESDNRNLRALIRQCGNRFCGFNNKAAEAERQRQVSELMGMVERTVYENGSRCYANRLYREPNLRDELVKNFLAENRQARKKAENALGWKEKMVLKVMVILSAFGFIYFLIERYFSRK